MLVNIIQNTISSFRSALASAEVITTNLKMWLGFETSETLGREEVVNGDFSTDSVWVKSPSGATITNSAVHFNLEGDAYVYQDVLVAGRTYQATFSGNINTGSFYIGENGVDTNVYSAGTYTNEVAIFTVSTSSRFILRRTLTGVLDGSISSVSLKELTQITPDKSGNNNVGELFTGKALEFDGSTSYVTADGFAGTLSTNTAFTIVMWFKSNQVSQSQPYQNIQMSGLESDGSTNVFKFGASANSTLKGIHYQDTAGPSNNYKINDTVNYNDNVWHRLVITRRSGTNPQTANFYVDGVNIGNCPSQIVWDDLAKFSIGQEYDGGNTPSDFFKGLISDVQIYNTDWLQADVTYDYANPQKLVTDRSGTSIELFNLKGYWAMSEGAGSVVYDSSGEGNNGTINGATYEPAQPRIPQLGMMNFSNGAVATGVTLIPDPNNTSQDILGNAVRDRLNSFNLDGSGYAEVADDTDLQFGTSAFTIQAWIKPFSLAANNRILTKGVTENGEFMISVGGDNASARVFAKDSNGNSLDTSNDFSSLNINSWQMITVIIDTPNDQILFFKNDGNVETKTGASWTGNFNNTQPITIGNTSNVSSGQFFDGLVSDALVYKDKALSADEIENNYNAGLSAHTN